MSTAAGVAELFPHIRIVMGTVVGLGITRILMGVAGLIQHPGRARISLLHLLWALSILIELILFWWWEFALYDISDWSFGIFAFLISYSVTLFLLGALLFPDSIEDYAGWDDFFIRRRHWFFGLFGLTFVLDVVDTVIKGEPYFDSLGLDYLVQVPIGIILCGLAIAIRDRRFHYGLVAAHLAYQAWWIDILFFTHT